MLFWLWMLFIDLLIPLTMIGFGRRFMAGGPAEINDLFGYRTLMSRINRDTWDCAHRVCGRFWFVAGLILLPLSVIPMLAVLGGGEDAVGGVGLVVCLVQLIPLCAAIPVTETALRRTFDEYGRRK
ncbi:MAG: SdpI family protein [Clostridia bacterium]|nr:SdpI family protein [Clostridia bacterium]